MQIYVYCQTRFIGFHRWPDAPENVDYLKSLHRHEFHVKVIVKVSHNNRDVEFITLKDQVDDAIKCLRQGCFTESSSCEFMASELAGELYNKYNYLVHSVEINEDGENGALVVCSTT